MGIPSHQCRNLHAKMEFEKAEMNRIGVARENRAYFIECGGGEILADRFCSTCRVGAFYKKYPNYQK